jgi:predicted amidohydrolase
LTRVTLLQPELFWEDRDANLLAFSKILEDLDEKTDVIFLPELFTTGFTMRSRDLAESMDGKTVDWMREMSGRLKADLVGSLIVRDHGKFYNRLIWMKPDGLHVHYDKRHLFRMSGEDEHYDPGRDRAIILSGALRFCPLICYDLRFPVWSRNQGDYDVLVYIANWPMQRRDVWRNLLVARAIENQAFVLGINRVGRDGMGIEYSGDTMAIDARGREMGSLESGKPGLLTIGLSSRELSDFRGKFPVWKDSDPFRLMH